MDQILLLHGALGSSNQMKGLQKALKPQRPVSSLTFSGHGGLPMNDDKFSIDLFTQDVLSFLDNKKVKKVNIFGFSMGGYVALHLALKHPNRVGKIYTLGTKLAWSPETAAKEVKMLNPAKIEEKVPVFAESLKKRHTPEDWKTVLHYTADMMTALGNGHALPHSQLCTIAHPIIISVGDEDNMVSIEESREVAEILPNGKLNIMQGFKHPIEQADTTVLTNELLKFF